MKDQAKLILIENNIQPRFLNFLDKNISKYKRLELIDYQNIKRKELDLFGCYVFDKIMKIIEISQKDKDFLPILGINIRRIKKDQIYLSRILKPSYLVSLRQFIKLLKNRQQLEIYQYQLLIKFQTRIQQIKVQKKQYLDWFENYCYDYYLIEEKEGVRIVIGICDIKLSSQNKNEQIQVLLQKLIERYSEKLIKHTQKDELKIIQKMELNYKDRIYQSNTYELLNSFFSKYAQNICDFISQSLNHGLTQHIYSTQIRRLATNILSFSMRNPQNNQIYTSNLYHNITCHHLDGIELQTFQRQQNCPICDTPLLYQKQKLLYYCQNYFHRFLLINFMNKQRLDVTYYFRQKIFTLKINSGQHFRQKFSNFHHYKMYVQRVQLQYKRKDIGLINRYETISLFNKLHKNRKYYNLQQIIECPVRGQYCRHWQFYDLRRVYEVMRESDDYYYECFVCCRQVRYEQILYLHEMKQLIQLVRQNMQLDRLIRYNINLTIDHDRQQMQLVIKEQDKQHNNQYRMNFNIYQTLNNPLVKSRYNMDYYQQLNIYPSQKFIQIFYGH